MANILLGMSSLLRLGVPDTPVEGSKDDIEGVHDAGVRLACTPD
jgi:hypothetical protein